MASVALKKNWLDAAIESGARGVHAMPVRLTPPIAAALLERNPDNRALAVQRVDLYAADIAAGRWRENGEPIIVSREGLLNDGQHRCAAVVKAGAPINTLLVFGIDRDTRTTTNQGKAKGAGDYAAMDGVKNANVVAAIARMTLSMDDNGSVHNSRTVSNSAVLEYIEQNRDDLEAAATFAQFHIKAIQKIVAASPFGFAYYHCAKINQQAADNFFQSIATGEMLVAGDPAFVARNRMLALGRAARSAKVELMFHAWNAYRRGETRTMLKINGQLPPLA